MMGVSPIAMLTIIGPPPVNTRKTMKKKRNTMDQVAPLASIKAALPWMM
jgi:hypothetical protein